MNHPFKAAQLPKLEEKEPYPPHKECKYCLDQSHLRRSLANRAGALQWEKAEGEGFLGNRSW